MFFTSSRSTSNLPHPSGRLSANTPYSPSKGSYDFGTNTFFSSGSEKGLIEYPFISHSSVYSNAHRYLSATARVPTFFPSITTSSLFTLTIYNLLNRRIPLLSKQSFEIILTSKYESNLNKRIKRYVTCLFKSF